MSSASVSSRSSEYPNRVFTPLRECDEAFEDDSQCGRSHRPRHHSSYEEMNGYTQEGQLHQYEDPRGLVDQVKRMNNPPPSGGGRARPRKKANDLYERCRTDSDVYGSDNSHNTSRRCGAPCWVVLLAIVLALAALALSVLLFTGLVTPKMCSKCAKEEVHSDMSTSASSSTARMMRFIKELQGNVSALHKMLDAKDAAIKDLIHSDQQQRDEILKLSKVPTYVIIKNARYNVSNLRGVRGPRGYNGSRGPPGPPGIPGKPGAQGSGANFSSCVYNMRSTAFTPSPLSGHDVSVREPTGWVIMGATCATEGAAQSNLRRLKAGLVVQYNCQCRGKAAGYPTTATCFIHFWLCPKH